MGDLEGLLVTLAASLEAGGFEFAVVGAFARNAWARPRATTDIDFAIALDAGGLDRLQKELEAVGLVPRRGRSVASEDPIPDLLLLALRSDATLKVDFLVAKTPFEMEALARRRRASVLGVQVPVVPPEAVVVYKLIAARSKDLGDAEDVLRTQLAAGVGLDLAFIERWTAEFDIPDRWLALRERLGI